MHARKPMPVEAKVAPESPFFDLIEEAYRVFTYPEPRSIGVCELCCMDATIEQDFFNPPVRELPLAYIRDWYAAAYEPEGIAKETWAYLLPRILEILAAGEEPSDNGIEVSLNRFDTGNPQSWSAAEWCILDSFQRGFLAHSLDHRDDFFDDVLCMFGLAGWSLADLLAQVTEFPDESLVKRLWQDWCRCIPGRESVWTTSFWEGPDRARVFKFYTSRELYERIEAIALGDNAEPELAAKASAVAKVIETSGD